MAEAVASILTIIALAKPVSILSKTIYEIARGSKIVRADMRSARRQLRLFANLVRHAAKSLQRYVEDGSAPASARWLAQYHVFGDLASETKHLEQGVYRQREKMQRLRSWTWDFWRSLRWTLMQPGFVKLQRNLQMFTALLSLALTTCMFEEATTRKSVAPNPDNDQRIAELTQKLEGCLIEVRGLRQEMRVPQTPPTSHGSPWSSGEWRDPGDVQRAVCHLATSMVETGAVPTTDPSTFSFRARPRVRRSSNSASEASSAPGSAGGPELSPARTRSPSPSPGGASDATLPPPPGPSSPPTLRTARGEPMEGSAFTQLRISGGGRKYVTRALTDERLDESLIQHEQARSFGLNIDSTKGPRRRVLLPSGRRVHSVGIVTLRWRGKKTTQFEHRSEMRFVVVEGEDLGAPIVLGRAHKALVDQDTLIPKKESEHEVIKTSPPPPPAARHESETASATASKGEAKGEGGGKPRGE